MFSFCSPSLSPTFPNLPVRLANDETAFNPKEYPNVIVTGQGQLSGKVRLVHGSAKTDESGLGLISIRVWVMKASHKKDVSVTPTFDGKTFTISLETPASWGANKIYHETEIQYPRAISGVDSLTVSVPNSSFKGDGLRDLLFGSIKAALSNGSIVLNGIRTDIAQLGSSNGAISGSYEVGHVDIKTSNAIIAAKLNLRDALDGRQSVVTARTSNAGIDVNVTATETSRGLSMENTSNNGRVKVNALVGRADRASSVKATTSNSKIDFSIDARQSGQPLEVTNKTSNAGIDTTVKVPLGQSFKGSASSTNGNVRVRLTEDYEGKFEILARNGTAAIVGSEVKLDLDTMTTKRGYRTQSGPGNFNVSTFNGPASIHFYPDDQSQASNEKGEQ